VKKVTSVLGLVLLASVQNVAADEPQSNWFASGFIDTYYQASSNQAPSGSSIFGRQFATLNERATLSNVQVSLGRNPDDEVPFGFNFTPWWGKNADIFYATEPGTLDFGKYLAAAYVTAKVSEATIDVGRFGGWIGYEGTDSPVNDLYTHSFNYTLGQPVYHTGARASIPLSEEWSMGAYVVQGWNEMEDINGEKSLGLSARYAPCDSLAFNFGWIGGREGGFRANRVGTYGGISFAAPGFARVDTFDLIASYQASKDLKVVFNGDYSVSDSNTDALQGSWRNAQLIARYAVSDSAALVARGEVFNDPDGIRTGQQNANLVSFAAGMDFSFLKYNLLRFEVRNDHANAALFAADDDKRHSQTLFTAAYILRFSEIL